MDPDAGRDAGLLLDASRLDAGADASAGDAGPRDASAGDASDDAALDGGALDGGGLVVDEIVTTVEGAVRGQVDGDLVVFRGIPYAAPPERWRPPSAHEPWSELRDATAFGPPCPQTNRDGHLGSEDCLYLNVWAHARGNPRPVMVFIHGGAFSSGQGDLGLYEGSDLARAGGVVVVTINYRLGILGFLTTETLAAESPDGSVGNYGIRDQIAALEWVERNIAAFGGDPSNVTVFGESAGAVSICALLGARAADGLFDRAILESGGGCHGFEDPRVTYPSRPSMMDRGQAFVTAAACDGPDPLGCLRARTLAELLDAQPPGRDEIGPSLLASLVYAPNVDGVLIEEDPIERVRRGGVDVPIVIGSNADEARAFTVTTVTLSWAMFESRVRAILGDALGDAVIPLYPRADYTPRQAFDAFGTDVMMTCPATSFAIASAAGDPTYVYHFTRVMNGVWGALGATHVIELFFVFGNWPDAYTPAPEDLVVEADMQGAWTSFATGGTPVLSPAWPAFAEAAPSFAIFDAPASIATEIRGGRCEELRRLGVVP